VQLHGGESEQYIAGVKRAVVQVIHIPVPDEASGVAVPRAATSTELMDSLRTGGAVALLLDATTREANGGTGRVFDWEIARRISEQVQGTIGQRAAGSSLSRSR
jgi:phosphoribosylanthranilate isomerase